MGVIFSRRLLLYHYPKRPIIKKSPQASLIFQACGDFFICSLVSFLGGKYGYPLQTNKSVPRIAGRCGQPFAELPTLLRQFAASVANLLRYVHDGKYRFDNAHAQILPTVHKEIGYIHSSASRDVLERNHESRGYTGRKALLLCQISIHGNTWDKLGTSRKINRKCLLLLL